MLSLFADTGYDKHRDSYNVRQHIEQRLDVSRDSDVVIKDIKSAEEDRTRDTYAGLPQRKYNESDSEPAALTESAVVCPSAHLVIHYVVKTATARDHTANDRRNVLIF